jgi:hypothetical protein
LKIEVLAKQFFKLNPNNNLPLGNSVPYKKYFNKKYPNLDANYKKASIKEYTTFRTSLASLQANAEPALELFRERKSSWSQQ